MKIRSHHFSVEDCEPRRLLSSISVAPITVIETNSTQSAILTAILDAPAAAPITLSYATANRTALANSDYRATKGSIKIPAGQTSASFAIPILGDSRAEPKETFVVNLTAAKGITLRSRSVVVTIVDDDPVPVVTLPDFVVAEGTKRPTTVTVPITLSNPSGSTVKIAYTTLNGTALTKSDFTAAKGSLLFKPGQTAGSIKLTIKNDAISEPDETLSLKILSASNASIASANSAGLFSRIVIADDDTAQLSRPSLSVADTTAIEGKAANFVFSLSAPTTRDVSFRYRAIAGTAAASRFAPTDGIATIAAGQTSTTVSIATTPDTLKQGDGQFSLQITAAANATVAKSSATATIIDDESFPSVSIANSSITEGNSGTANEDFIVTLSSAYELPVTVNFATSDATATAGSDYTAVSNSLTFAPGETTKTISVPIIGDTTVEPTETFAVTLSSPTNAVVHAGPATGTIVNDDTTPPPAPPTVSIVDASTMEGNTGTANLAFTVTLSAASMDVVQVAYTTSDGSASAGSDYTMTSNVLVFMPGQTSQQILVPIIGDTTVEMDETFTVTLNSPVNATLGRSGAVGTILNDDVQAPLSISSPSALEGNSGMSILFFQVTLASPAIGDTSILYTVADGSATQGIDYSLASGSIIIPNGQTSANIPATIFGDTNFEQNETFTVTVFLGVDQATGTATILNDDMQSP